MLIRKVDRNTYDVFGGVGWNWTRLRKFHWGFKPIQGEFLPRETLKEVIDRLTHNPNGSIENV